MRRVDVSDEIDALFEGFDVILAGLGNEFTYEQFRKAMTQRNQVAYIRLLSQCAVYEKPFGQAHWFIGEALLKRISNAYDRKEIGPSGGEYDIFGGRADTVRYRRR